MAKVLWSCLLLGGAALRYYYTTPAPAADAVTEGDADVVAKTVPVPCEPSRVRTAMVLPFSDPVQYGLIDDSCSLLAVYNDVRHFGEVKDLTGRTPNPGLYKNVARIFPVDARTVGLLDNGSGLDWRLLEWRTGKACAQPAFAADNIWQMAGDCARGRHWNAIFSLDGTILVTIQGTRWTAAPGYTGLGAVSGDTAALICNGERNERMLQLYRSRDGVNSSGGISLGYRYAWRTSITSEGLVLVWTEERRRPLFRLYEIVDGAPALRRAWTVNCISDGVLVVDAQFEHGLLAIVYRVEREECPLGNALYVNVYCRHEPVPSISAVEVGPVALSDSRRYLRHQLTFIGNEIAAAVAYSNGPPGSDTANRVESIRLTLVLGAL